MKQSGQNLGEYSLAFGLIVIVCIGVLSLMGDNVNQMFSSMFTKRVVSAPPVPPLNATPPASTGGTPVAAIPNTPPSSFANLPGKVLTVDVGNGKTLRLNMADPVAVVEAAGGNGVTESYLAVLEQIIAQMEAQNADENDIAPLRELSQKGFYLRDLLATVKTQGIDSPEGKVAFAQFNNTGIYTNVVNLKPNQTYEDFYARGFLDDFSTVQEIPWMRETRSPAMKDFINAIVNVKDAGVYDRYPALKAIVQEKLAKEIYVAVSATRETEANNGTIKQAIRITNDNSSDICSLSRAISCENRPG